LVFPSPFYPGKSLSHGTLNSALARLGYKGMATAHGFRTLFSTCANEAGWNSDVIEKQRSDEERDDAADAPGSSPCAQSFGASLTSLVTAVSGQNVLRPSGSSSRCPPNREECLESLLQSRHLGR
jgi:hypothetical protein